MFGFSKRARANGACERHLAHIAERLAAIDLALDALRCSTAPSRDEVTEQIIAPEQAEPLGAAAIALPVMADDAPDVFGRCEGTSGLSGPEEEEPLRACDTEIETVKVLRSIARQLRLMDDDSPSAPPLRCAA